jgi:nucleolar protein 6
MQAALKLHHTQLAGRRINVELTAGGGGKSDARTAKLSERNERVGVQRVRREEKEREAAIKEGAPLEHAPRVWGEAQGMAAITAKRKTREELSQAKAAGNVAVPEKTAVAELRAAAVALVEKPAASASQPVAKTVDTAKSAEAPANAAEYQDGMKIRGGRRVKVKGKVSRTASQRS